MSSPEYKSRSGADGNLTPAAIYTRLLKMCAPHWKMFILSALAMVVYAATDTGFAFLMKNLVQYLQPEGLTPEEARLRELLPVAILLLFIVRGIVSFLSAYCLGWIGRNVIMLLRAEVFSKFLRLPTQFFDDVSAGEMLSRLTFNVEQVAEATSKVVTTLIRDSMAVIGLLAYMTYLSPRLTAVLFVTAPLMGGAISYLSKVFRKHSMRIQSSVGDVARVTEEALQSHKVVKIFGGQDYENKRFGEINYKNTRLNLRLIATTAAGDAVINIVIAIGVAAVMYFVMFAATPPPTDELVGFITAMVFLLRPIRKLTGINVKIQRGIAAGMSIFELIDSEDEPDKGAYVVERARGDVEFKDVNFTYSLNKGAVLNNISLAVPAGQSLAIVGRSGSGKSTLVSLLPRFYDVEQGQILIDGRLINEYRLDSLRDQISLVSQEVVLFNDTIANNIAYGRLSESSREEIEAAAYAAFVDDFVKDLPDGLDTEVGDRGVLLSGGQRQRIAIARALLKNSPVLILDEATSALDTASERHIQQALERLMQNRTTFVIAHRLSTVENADRIIVMSEGRIIESGTHAELLAHGGEYAQLYRSQFKEEENG
ncbi:MAG: lipid A export permease/ATP-binding protein MsbA [Gammaproteobacteria bacterium]|nr:lipid A export permease/ATP-binding protein MsbA [Gammaproteobacteria bacterium]